MFLWDTHIVGHYADQHPALMLHIQRVEWHEVGLPPSNEVNIVRS